MSIGTSLRVATVVLLVAAFPVAVSAADMTGTWEGRVTCDRSMDDASPTRVTEDVTVQIAQVGENVIRVAMEVPPGGLQFEGVVVDDGVREANGRFFATMCGGDPTDGAFAFTGTVTRTNLLRAVLNAELDGFIGGIQPVVFHCRLAAARTTTADPAVPACGP
jgi:hypothetical protein